MAFAYCGSRRVSLHLGRESGIDVMVEFEPDGVPGLEFVYIASESSGLLGRPLDTLTRFATKRSPNHIRRKDILGSAEVSDAAPLLLLAGYADHGAQSHPIREGADL